MHPLIEVWFVLAFCVWDSIRALFRLVYAPRKSLKGEIVLVTGGGSGIGRLMCLEFSKRGSTIVVVDIVIDGANKVVEEIKASGGSAFAYACDVTDRQKVYDLAKTIESEVGSVSILVNNAGIVTGKKLLDAPDALIEKTFQVNTISHFWTLKAFLPNMIEKNHGHIVTIASMAGHVGNAGLVDYCASKFGAVGTDESLRLELAKLGKTGVKTTCVCPYFIDTGMFDGARSKFPLLVPILTPQYAVGKILKAVETDEERILLPPILNLVLFCRGVLTVKSIDALLRFLGVLDSMDDFKGRAKKED